ncbi:MAG: hypothetical protein AAGI09_11810 [Pseudomonadota bacterium]
MIDEEFTPERIALARIQEALQAVDFLGEERAKYEPLIEALQAAMVEAEKVRQL